MMPRLLWLIVSTLSWAATIDAAPDRIRRELNLADALIQGRATPLPRNLIPSGYRLELQPKAEEGVFQGKVRINVTCEESVDTFHLHAHHSLQLNESDIQVLWLGGGVSSDPKSAALKIQSVPPVEVLQPVQVSTVSRDSATDILVITVAEKLRKGGSYALQIQFSGPVHGNKTEGLFRNSYKHARTKEIRWFVATQLKPALARHVFPCWDEPGFKATIELSVARPKDMHVLASTPLRLSEESPTDPSIIWDHFEPSPPMSPFSLGIVVSDLEHLPEINVPNQSGGVKLRIYGQKSFLDQLTNELSDARQVIELLQGELHCDFPLPKLDLVALPYFPPYLPADHWGLVLFAEGDLVAAGVQERNAHWGPWLLTSEIENQWFRHLITPASWRDARVGKALADFLTTRHMLQLQLKHAKNWKSTIDYSLYYKYSKPQPNQRTSDEGIVRKTIFLFRMLSYTLSANTFHSAIRKMIQEKRFGTYTETELWNTLSEQAWNDKTLDEKIQVWDIAQAWITYDRFPVVTITRNYEKNTAEVKQHMFLRERPHQPAQGLFLCWWIPIMYLTPQQLDPSAIRPVVWLSTNKTHIQNLPGAKEFIIVNPEEIGMFMVNYDEVNWRLLIDYLGSSKRDEIPSITRAKLLHDAWNLALGGELSFLVPLDMTKQMQKQEYSPAVWHVFMTMREHVTRMLAGTAHCTPLELMFFDMINQLNTTLSNKTELEEENKTLLNEARRNLCEMGHSACLDEAGAAWKIWAHSEDAPWPDPKHFCVITHYGNNDQWELAWQKLTHYSSKQSQSDRSLLLSRMAACTKDSKLLFKLVRSVFLEGEQAGFSERDARMVANVFSGNYVGALALQELFASNWGTLAERMKDKPDLFNLILKTSIECTKKNDEFQKVLNSKMTNGENAVDSLVSSSKANMAEERTWRDRAEKQIESWFNSQKITL